MLLDTKDLVKAVTEVILKELYITNRANTETPQDFSNQIPVGVSNRHVHLSVGDLYKLLGDRARITNFKDLSQPGQFACEEKATLVGPSCFM